MEITSTIRVSSRAEWRSWLVANHATETEIWIVSDENSGQPSITYLDSVEEAICFGWIDGIAKSISGTEKAQRFTPRRARSNWTELNKERARRLIRLGLMTDAGTRTLPDLSAKFEIASDILEAITVASMDLMITGLAPSKVSFSCIVNLGKIRRKARPNYQ
jgi:hypothetical protein